MLDAGSRSKNEQEQENLAYLPHSGKRYTRPPGREMIQSYHNGRPFLPGASESGAQVLAKGSREPVEGGDR